MMASMNGPSRGRKKWMMAMGPSRGKMDDGNGSIRPISDGKGRQYCPLHHNPFRFDLKYLIRSFDQITGN